jgi:hypothetical protein
MHDRDHAIAACGSVILKEGCTLNDYLRYMKLIITKRGDLSDKEIKSLSNVLDRLRLDPAGKVVVDQWACEVGLRTENIGQLEECTAALGAKAPNASTTIFYQWALAMHQGDLDLARALVERSKSSDMPAETRDRLERETSDAESHHSRNVFLGAVAGVLGLIALASAIYLWLMLRKRGGDATPPLAATEASAGGS